MYFIYRCWRSGSDFINPHYFQRIQGLTKKKIIIKLSNQFLNFIWSRIGIFNFWCLHVCMYVSRSEPIAHFQHPSPLLHLIFHLFQGWEFAHRFSELIAHFLQIIEWVTWANCSFAHLWWATWAICSHRSFLVNDLSDLLISLIKKEVMSESLIFLK